MQIAHPDNLSVRTSLCGGKGLFAVGNIPAGTYLCDYIGEIITTSEADARDTKYLFAVDDDYVIDGEDTENIARYYNHFCTPNIEAIYEDGRIQFYTTQDIKNGEEMGFDYGKEYCNQFIAKRTCRCPTCRSIE